MKAVPKIITSHEWISLVLGKRRLTISYGGVKAGGGIPDAVFDLWDKAVRLRTPEALTTLGLAPDKAPGQQNKLLDIIQAFADKIDTIWPDWAKEPVMPVPGATIKVNFGKRKGIIEGVVKEVKRNYVFATFPVEAGGYQGVHFDMIVG